MIAYETHGSGPDIVLVHGVGLDRTMWHLCLPRLVAEHRVTTLDLRGHGASPVARPGTRLGDLAADVVEVLDAVGTEQAHLVGFSLGALVAQKVAVTDPSRVASLTLVSSVANRTELARAAVLARLTTAREDRPATVAAAIDRWFSHEWAADAPELVSMVRTAMLGTDPASYVACYEIFATADAEVWPQLPGIKCPTLVVTGEDDPGSTPAMARRLAGTISDADALVLADTRHLLPLERPGALCDALLHHIERTTS